MLRYKADKFKPTQKMRKLNHTGNGDVIEFILIIALFKFWQWSIPLNLKYTIKKLFKMSAFFKTYFDSSPSMFIS